LPYIEGDGAVTERHATNDRLRQAFHELAETTTAECSPEDLARIWRALDGDMPPEERRLMVERLAIEPALAEAWRLAYQLRQGVAGATVESPAWWRRPTSWLAAAAVALLAVTVGLIVPNRDRVSDDAMRDAGVTRVEPLPSTDTLPRDGFRLRWTAGPAGSRYDVRVTTEDLRLLANVTGLTQPEVLIDPRLLQDVPSGARVFWQVDVILSTGVREASRTFDTRVQ
jgi:hypothetical protein